MKQNQISHSTLYNRYPKIFKEVASIITNPKQILSFGCSTGMECNTLRQLYFPKSKIIGLDINEEIIRKNTKNNVFTNIEYVSSAELINEKCDLIFVMSVLCRWPESAGEYSFELFTDTLNTIDKLLETNGHLSIYNSKYLFTETELFKEKYETVETVHKETGFVSKYHNNNVKYKGNYPFFLFRKKTA